MLFSSILVVACQEEGKMIQQAEVEKEDSDPVELDLGLIQERDTLIAIVNNSSTGYFIYRGQPMGYEYELLNRLAESLDLALDIKLTNSVDEAIQLLNSGEGDIIAYNMAVTAQHKERVAFTEHHNEVKQVLIQRKPPNWRQRKRHQIEEYLIRNPLALDGKEVWVPANSSYATRLENLSEEIGGEIQIVEKELDSETLIRMVADGEIDFTVAKEDLALVNATYHSIIDVNTPISFPQKIAWATRINAPDLLEAVNAWIRSMKQEADYYVIYNKYYKSPKATLRRVRSDYSSLTGNAISPYDGIIKQAADSLGWDWRLLAAQAYQESKFDARAESWAGAVGLMQLMPATGEMYGVDDMLNPNQSLNAAVAYLNWLDKIWEKYIADDRERIKFVLASYNAGQGHVLDARRLARKHGEDPESWSSVSKYLLLKSKPEYYNDPVAKSGYVRGAEPVNYVREILTRYERYRQLVGEDSAMAAIKA
ncbi:transglycosylase SLT domain-containing protein [Tunicatimonas pelagia]|uniref:transglycosylase SLT domain-containing protein n=1 Tax=Tunicatimonas pelagia TaxID=931531 RepID=UPI00266542EA|nr:transporter substrate-binding domain-containing protein [Tunicatimonas pelagia]WKN46050.1 transporter substrate-binding domain-containing protein [Tunicatimonas pelagia]